MPGEREFLGRGVGFPIRLAAGGGLQAADYEESVRQSLLIILGTAKGERVMRPDFGCSIYDLVFETKTAAIADKISQAAREALVKFEPRIDILDISVIPQTDEMGEKLLVNIDYKVRSTNNIFNLVYPFYLERSSG
jgi:phage baseplate assembly protein W